MRDYDTPQIAGADVGHEEPLLDTRPELPGDAESQQLPFPNEAGWRIGSDVNSLD